MKFLALLVPLTLCMTAPPLQAQGSPGPAPAAQNSACDAKTGEEAATCRREEAAVRQEEKRGQLETGIGFARNARARCDPLTGTDREDCLKRVEGQGLATGSVESGGIYRETRTITVGPSGPDASTNSAPANGGR